jgi:hypothetical protein
MKKLILSLIAVGALAFGADVTGKWTAEVPGRGGTPRTQTFTLKQDGSALTGTASGMQGQENPISEGKVDGDKVSFAVKVEFNGNAFKMTYSGEVKGDEIKMKQTREGSDQVREFTAKKAK